MRNGALFLSACFPYRAGPVARTDRTAERDGGPWASPSNRNILKETTRIEHSGRAQELQNTLSQALLGLWEGPNFLIWVYRGLPPAFSMFLQGTEVRGQGALQAVAQCLLSPRNLYSSPKVNVSRKLSLIALCGKACFP